MTKYNYIYYTERKLNTISIDGQETWTNLSLDARKPAV